MMDDVIVFALTGVLLYIFFAVIGELAREIAELRARVKMLERRK